jgi:spore coat polysaccharide biosynthesis protein SpsF (cytidylyltransferase family)
MPKPTESYVKNMVIRYLLTEAGGKCGFKEFSKKDNWETIIQAFDNRCCYCHNDKELEADHIIGMNISELGLDCLGNVAPACGSCNKKKNNLARENDRERYGWDIHLESVCNNIQEYRQRKLKIQNHMKRNNYEVFILGSDSYKKFKKLMDTISEETQIFLSTNKELLQAFLDKLAVQK